MFLDVTIKSVFDLCRVSNLPTVWMNILTAALLTANATSQPVMFGNMILLLLSMSCFYCGGMSLNDLCDRHWDAHHQPFRPIPSGKISITQVRIITLMLLVAGLVLLLFTPDIDGFWAGIVLLSVIYLYDVYHKRHPVTVLLMPVARLLVFIIYAEAVAGEVSRGVWIAGSLQFCYIGLITIVARHENTRNTPYPFPLIPWLIASIAVLDGIVLAVIISPLWLAIGFVVALATHFGQYYVRGG